MNGHRLPATPDGRLESQLVAEPAQAAAPPGQRRCRHRRRPSSHRDELEVLIRARYPIIYVVTWEEERLEQRLLEIAKKRNKTLHVWTCSQGVVQFGAEPQRGKSGSGNTCDPVAGLDAVLGYVEPGIFLFKDLHDHLDIAYVRRQPEEYPPPTRCRPRPARYLQDDRARVADHEDPG